MCANIKLWGVYQQEGVYYSEHIGCVVSAAAGPFVSSGNDGDLDVSVFIVKIGLLHLYMLITMYSIPEGDTFQDIPLCPLEYLFYKYPLTMLMD